MGVRRTTRSKTVRRQARRHRARGMGGGTGRFPGLVVVLIFFGVFDASVAQASSEGWFGRFLDRSLCFCFVRRGARARVHVIAACPGKEQLFDLVHQPSPRAVRGSRNVPRLPGVEATAAQPRRDAVRRAELQDLKPALKARLRLEATRRPHASTARPRNHCAGAPSPSAATRPRAPPWTKAPRARRVRVRTARNGSPPS